MIVIVKSDFPHSAQRNARTFHGYPKCHALYTAQHRSFILSVSGRLFCNLCNVVTLKQYPEAKTVTLEQCPCKRKFSEDTQNLPSLCCAILARDQFKNHVIYQTR